MSYCVVNYNDPDMVQLHALGTISPITPEVEGLLLEEIPPNYRIIGGSTRNTDVGILACRLEKIPEIMPGSVGASIDIPPIEPITSVYVPKNISIIPDGLTIYKNIIKMFEKKVVPLFGNKELLLFNSKNAVASNVKPTNNQVLINFNSIPDGIPIRTTNFKFNPDLKIQATAGLQSDQVFPHCIHDLQDRPLIQGTKNIIYVHWDALSIVSDARILIDVFFVEFVKMLNEDISSIDFSVKKIAKIYNSIITSRISEVKSNISYKSEDIKNVKKKLIDLSNFLRDEEYRLQGLITATENMELDIKNRVNAMFGMKEIENVELTGSLLNIYTKPLFFKKNSSEIYFIGAFLITINVRDTTVIFKNKAILVNGYNNGMNAPHVFPDGHACLGNLAGDLPLCIKDGAIDMAAVLCINFLTSVNSSDAAGRFFQRWPKVVEGKLKYENMSNVRIIDKTYDDGKEITVL